MIFTIEVEEDLSRTLTKVQSGDIIDLKRSELLNRLVGKLPKGVTVKVYCLSSAFEASQIDTQTADLISRLDTSEVQDFSYCFADADIITPVDLSNWDMSQAIETEAMFKNTHGNGYLTLGQWQLRNVTNAALMFACFSVPSNLDEAAPHFFSNKRSRIVDISEMFWGCTQLRKADLSAWKIHHKSYVSSIFKYSTFYGKISLQLARALGEDLDIEDLYQVGIPIEDLPRFRPYWDLNLCKQVLEKASKGTS